MTAAGIYLLRQVEFYRRRADELLHNMLPAPVAARLKEKQQTIADAYDQVTVLFADMVGSTPLFAGLEPAEAVDWLNEVFLMFDQLVERYGLEKIRTIGDNYMVAAGVPLPRPDHAQVMTAFALDMLRGLEMIPARRGRKMAFRVGINSGPVVAGVIGRAKYQYDLWGDTVNLASRMESQGQPGQVQVSAATYALIKDDFDCTGRGAIPIKGKGEMETWYVSGRKGDGRPPR
jgi:adenylate cyclase